MSLVFNVAKLRAQTSPQPTRHSSHARSRYVPSAAASQRGPGGSLPVTQCLGRWWTNNGSIGWMRMMRIICGIYWDSCADEPTWGCKILKFCKQSNQDFQKHGEINLEKLSYNRFVIRSLKTANKQTHTHTASKQTNTQCKRSLGNSVKRRSIVYNLHAGGVGLVPHAAQFLASKSSKIR